MSGPQQRLIKNLRGLAKDVRDERVYGILGRGKNYTDINAPRKNNVWITLGDGHVISLPNVGSGHVPLRPGLRVRMIRKANGALVLDGQDDRFMQDDPNQPNAYGLLPHPITSHTDIDSSYDGHGGDVLRVNNDEDGIEFHPLTTSDIPEGSNLYHTDERVRDAIALALVQGSNITITVNDAGDTITIAAVGPGGISYIFSTTTADADPTSGKLRFNNATFASITQLYIDDLDANANDVQSWINALDDSTSTVRGHLTIFKASNPAVYRIFAVTGALTDPGGYTKIAVSPIVSNGVLADADPIIIMFARTGDKGDTGSTGGTGGTGATGAQGGFGGDSMEYKFSTTTTDADPTSGFLRFDSGTFASITRIFIDDLNNQAVDVQAWIDSLDDSTSTTVKGVLRIFKESDPTNVWRVFNITAANIDPGGYTKLVVTPVVSFGSLANNDVVVVSFTPAGNIPTGTLLADGSVALSADWVAGAARAITIGTLYGSAASGGNLTLMSTSHATKGKLLFGASAYDEVNDRLGVGTNAPGFPLDVQATVDGDVRVRLGNLYYNAASSDDTTTLEFAFYANNAAALRQAALIQAIKADNWTNSGNRSSHLAFSTANAAVVTEWMRILNTGLVLAGGLTSGNANVLGIKAGASTNDAAVGGGVYDDTTQTGNVGAGEDDLASYSVPANTLSANGMSLQFEAAGTTAANANGKTLRIRFGTTGTNLMITAVLTFGGGTKWIARGRVIRTGAATQKSYVEVTNSGSSIHDIDIVTTLNQTLSGAVTLKITGEATSNNDIVIESFRVWWDDHNT